MAEVVGVVGSALGIVGFAGQILQGCQNIRTFLDSINDASDDLRLFRTEVKIFLSLLESFRATITEVDWSGEGERWDLARLALDYSDEAVNELQSLVNEYGSRKPGRWNDVRLVMRKGKFEKHLGRMEKAKGYILASRTNLSFILELKKSGLHQNTEETLRAVSVLNAKVSATANIVASVPNHLQGVGYATLETRDAIENLTRSISEGFAHIPTDVNKMLQGTFSKVIQDFHDHLLLQANDASKPPPDYASVQNSTISQKLLSGCKNSGRKVLKQKQGRVAIQTWFGVVFIHSTLVKAQDTVNQHGLKIRLGTAKTIRMHVEVAITPCLLRIGLFCSIIWNKIPENRSGFDVKLRVHNNVDETSPIIQACQDANIEQVQHLFAAGKASPFDRIRGKHSLLDIILEEMILLPMRQDPEFALRKLRKLYLLFQMIVSHGLDPGQLWSHQDNRFPGSPLSFLAEFCFFAPPDVLPVILDTTRTIIEHSVQDPFSTADFTELLRFLQSAKTRTPLPVSQLIMNQEHWQPEWEIKQELTPFRQGQQPEELGPSDAGCFRRWLRHGADRREALMAAREGHYNVTNAVHYGGMPDEIADRLRYQHLVGCLEFGIDFQDERDGPSLLTLFRESGKLYHMRAALWYFNWKDDDITELFEADLVASLVFQLAHLERREFDGRNLPAELEFKSILPSYWNSYLEMRSSWSPDQKVPRSTSDSHVGQLKAEGVSEAMHNSAYIESQFAWTGREISKLLTSFPFVIIAVVVVAFAIVSNVLKVVVY